MNTEFQKLSQLKKNSVKLMETLSIGHNKLVRSLWEMKQIIGLQGVKSFIGNELYNSGMYLQTSINRLMLEINTIEMFEKREIYYDTYKSISIKTWTRIRKFVNKNNIDIMKTFLISGGSAEKLIAEYSAGKTLSQDIFTSKLFFQKNDN